MLFVTGYEPIYEGWLKRLYDQLFPDRGCFPFQFYDIKTGRQLITGSNIGVYVEVLRMMNERI